MQARNLGDFSEGLAVARPAVIDLSGGGERSFDYGAYIAAIDGVAAMLARYGFPRGSRVGLIGRNSFEYLAAYFGIMKAGLVAVPINHRFPKEMVDFVIEDSHVRMLIGEEAFLKDLPADVERLTFAGIAGVRSEAPFSAIAPEADETAMILYTSGSTGRPKGVPLSHAGQLWVVGLRSSMAQYASHRILVAAPLCHMNGLLTAKLAAFNGAQIVLMPEFAAQRYIEAIDRFRCTWLTSVPTMLALVAREREKLAVSDLSSVQIAAMGSAPASISLFNEIARLFPSATVVTNYGTTEAGAAIFGSHPEGLPRPPLSLGCPLPQIDFRLVGPDGRPAREGVMQVRTPAMTTGYINRPEATEKLFTADGWLTTGDVIRQDEQGFCYFVRRADDMFVCGGENVYPAAVEEVLETHPAVEQACVVPVPDELKGAKPIAYVVLKAGASVSEDALKQHALAHAPAFMHPRRVIFVDQLPLSPTNKVDRSLLQRQAQELAA